MSTLGLGVENARLVDVGSEEYHSINAISNSMLKKHAESPELCYRQYVARDLEMKESPAFEFGKRLERLVMFDEQPNAVIVPEAVMQVRKKANSDETTLARAGKPYNAWKDEMISSYGEDVNLYTVAEYAAKVDPLLNAQAELQAHPLAKPLLWGAGRPHLTILWDDVSTGHPIACKCQLDFLLDVDIIVDLKSAAPVMMMTRKKLLQKLADYKYHWQAFWYRHAVAALTGKVMPFAFVYVMSEEPYRVECVKLTESWYDDAEIGVRNQFAKVVASMKTGSWRPDTYGTWIEEEMPEYLKGQSAD